MTRVKNRVINDSGGIFVFGQTLKEKENNKYGGTKRSISYQIKMAGGIMDLVV